MVYWLIGSDDYHCRIQLIMQCGHVVVLQSRDGNGVGYVGDCIFHPRRQSQVHISPSPSGIRIHIGFWGFLSFLKIN